MKTASDPRHLSRQNVVQELFAFDAQNNLQATSEGKTPKSTLSPKTIQVIDNLKSIDQIIAECAPEWEIGKLNQIDLAILRLAIFELICEANEPAKVVMDEAVELAKEFGTESSPSFVNGALGKAFYLPIRIKKMIAGKLGIEEEKITGDANLTTDLNATDLEISDLIANIEKEYNFSLGKSPTPQTVEELIEIIEEQNE